MAFPGKLRYFLEKLAVLLAVDQQVLSCRRIHGCNSVARGQVRKKLHKKYLPELRGKCVH